MMVAVRNALLFLFLLSQFCAAQPLRVMSYNVRYPSKNDGANLWEKRRDLFIDSIRQANPDLIGTQELFKLQGDFLVERLPAFAWFGTSRRGNDEDEHMGVFYKKNRLRVVEQGQFWLSETPDVPGSQSWNMSLPRMVTWALFESGGRRFYFFNTHFAHRPEDEDARIKSAKLIVEQIAKIAKDAPAIVTGDFNAPAGGAVHTVLLSGGLKDSRDLAVEKLGPAGTFHGFQGKPGEARIDWILVSPHWKILRNETVTMHDGDRYPSDHFPIVVDLDLR